MDGPARLAAILGFLVARVGLDFRNEWLLQGLAVLATDQVAFGLVLVQPPLRVDGLVKLGLCIGMYPRVQKKYGGTVGGTAVGMFGTGGGWGIPINDHTLDVTLGGIVEKPGVVDGQIAIREYLCLSFNHALIDGAPAAHFAQRLKDLIESGYGLCEGEAEIERRHAW